LVLRWIIMWTLSLKRSSCCTGNVAKTQNSVWRVPAPPHLQTRNDGLLPHPCLPRVAKAPRVLPPLPGQRSFQRFWKPPSRPTHASIRRPAAIKTLCRAVSPLGDGGSLICSEVCLFRSATRPHFETGTGLSSCRHQTTTPAHLTAIGSSTVLDRPSNRLNVF